MYAGSDNNTEVFGYLNIVIFLRNLAAQREGDNQE